MNYNLLIIWLYQIISRKIFMKKITIAFIIIFISIISSFELLTIYEFYYFFKIHILILLPPLFFLLFSSYFLLKHNKKIPFISAVIINLTLLIYIIELEIYPILRIHEFFQGSFIVGNLLGEFRHITFSSLIDYLSETLFKKL